MFSIVVGQKGGPTGQRMSSVGFYVWSILCIGVNWVS